MNTTRRPRLRRQYAKSRDNNSPPPSPDGYVNSAPSPQCGNVCLLIRGAVVSQEFRASNHRSTIRLRKVALSMFVVPVVVTYRISLRIYLRNTSHSGNTHEYATVSDTSRFPWEGPYNETRFHPIAATTETFYRSLILKELKGKASSEDSQIINYWIDESSENLKIYNQICSSYALALPDHIPITTDKEAAWSRLVEKITFSRQHSSLFIQFSRIAAAAVLFFLIGIAFQYYRSDKIPSEFLNQYTTIIVPEGQKSMVVLPDGSNVWLNSGSRLKYKSDFNTSIRQVEMEGEAFFEVKKDKSKMFKVNAGAINVEVYGTAFNIKNYSDEKNLEVTVESGNVGVLKGGTQLANLIKGDQATIVADADQVHLSQVNVEIVTAWKNNELIFDGTPFEEGIRYLERWYGVNIKIEEKMRKKHNYTFKVKTESLRELLKLLQVITPLTYKIDGKNVTIKYDD